MTEYVSAISCSFRGREGGTQGSRLGFVTRAVAGIAVAVAVLSGCSSSSKSIVVVPQVPSASTVRTAANPERAAPEFREVEASIPYAGPTAATTATGFLPATCENGKLVTPTTRDVATARVVLPDRARTSC